VWIALTTSLVAAMGGFLAYRQTDNALLKYNQAITDLANIKVWWHALSAEEQTHQQFIDSLIGHTEKVLQLAMDGGMAQLQGVLADLRPEQEAIREKEPLKQAAFADAASYKRQAPADEQPAAEAFNPETFPPAGPSLSVSEPLPEAENPLVISPGARPPAIISGKGINAAYQEEVASSKADPNSLSSVQGRGNGNA
jgi:hypothetical protein